MSIDVMWSARQEQKCHVTSCQDMSCGQHGKNVNDMLAVLAKITHHDYSNKIKDKMAKFTKR